MIMKMTVVLLLVGGLHFFMTIILDVDLYLLPAILSGFILFFLEGGVCDG